MLIQKATRIVSWPKDSRASAYHVTVQDGIEVQQFIVPLGGAADVSTVVQATPGSRVVVEVRAIGSDNVPQYPTRFEYTAATPGPLTIDAPQGVGHNDAGFVLVER